MGTVFFRQAQVVDYGYHCTPAMGQPFARKLEYLALIH